VFAEEENKIRKGDKKWPIPLAVKMLEIGKSLNKGFGNDNG
jgi:hypothetical protein